MDKATRRMLDDIEREIQYTRHQIGRDHFDTRVMQAMARVPRVDFVPDDLAERAYDNGALPIGHGQTISQPYIVALMTDLLEPEPDQVVLEVGTGSGYQTAVLSLLYRQVYSLEIVPELSAAAAQRLQRLGYHNVETRVGDGHAGWPEHAPYDAIIVTAAAAQVPPALLEQLRPGGRMVVPVGPPYQYQVLKLLEKQDTGAISSRELIGVAFVPMVGAARAKP